MINLMIEPYTNVQDTHHICSNTSAMKDLQHTARKAASLLIQGPAPATFSMLWCYPRYTASACAWHKDALPP